jgi:ribitol-5-phosphate 2-dehydrogenase
LRTLPESIGVWGDGSMGFTTALALRVCFPKSKLYVFGKNARKLQKFTFADRTYYIDSVPENLAISAAFECVGGEKSKDAVNQIVEHIIPQGTISLLGVAENPIAINTRLILEKGVKIIGNSRSDRDDFLSAVKMIEENRVCKHYLKLLISEIIDVNVEDDITYAFEQDMLNDFKTVIRWHI